MGGHHLIHWGPNGTKRGRKGKFSLSLIWTPFFSCPLTPELLVELWPLNSSLATSAPLGLWPSVADWVTPLASLGLQPTESGRWWAFSVSRNTWIKWANSYNQSISNTHTYTHTHIHTHTPESLENPNRIFTYYLALSSSSCVCMLRPFSCCLILWDSTDCSPPGSWVHRTSQARILEWVLLPSPRGSSQSRYWTRISCISCIGRWVLYH